ncbi:unnamed protein product [Rotaria socialis]|uniref:Uncharacterized protein n=1 Tax=Rotaria socialis TaxID=392032 RepID=A0A821AVN0_9BILA|nr:unnamed protein product [Rotaria socialis]CAF4578216.1 unnamed protein product [Rotaria socialis]
MISSNGLKRKSSTPISTDNNNTTITTTTTAKRFRGSSYDGKIHHNEQQTLLSKIKSTKMTINNSKQEMTSEYRQLQYELQCQEALLVLMQKLKTNQRITSQTNQKPPPPPPPTTTTTTTTTKTPVNTSKLNSTTPTKQQPLNSTNRSTPTKSPHPNQYTVNRSNNNLQVQPVSKSSQSLPQATRQSTNSTQPATATRLSSTVPTTATKNSSLVSTTNNSSKNNGITTDQHLFNAKLALRKQLEQTLLQIPTPKPTICDLTYIPGINGWAEFLTLVGLEQAYNTYSDIVNRRFSSDVSMTAPNVCAQCGTDWSVTWHDVSSASDIDNKDEKILCDRCRKTSQKKILKQDHSNRLRQAFMKALQQEKELDAKFQQQAATTVKQQPPAPAPAPAPSSSSHHKHSNKPLSTKINSNHQSTKHTNNNNNNNNNHRHHHSGKTSSSKHPIPADTFASALAALPTNEQIELFQKHFLSNMFPFAVANQAAALAAKTTQQQQQALAASLPAMAASLMRQGNPAQYLLDMIPQAAKQQQQQQQQQHHHHRHSK